MPAPDAWRRTIAPAAIIAGAILLAYANALNTPFVLDDQASVLQNEDIRDISNLWRVLWPTPNSPTAGRPLASLSFALNYAAGGVNPFGYHVINLLIHLGCALLVFGIVRRSLSWPHIPESWSRHAGAVALASALLWCVHPLTSEMVAYVTQRTESLMALCLLATVYAAIRDHGASDGRWHGVATGAALCGALSKESIVVVPVLVALYDRAYLFATWRDAWAARRHLYMGLVACWFVVASLLSGNPRGAVGGFSSGVDVWTYLLNQARVVVGYLTTTVWPVRLVAFYGWPEALTLRDVWFQGLVMVGLLAGSVVLWRLRPRAGFWALWVFVSLAPTSSVVPIATEVGADRRMYVPLLALTTLAAMSIWRVASLWTLRTSTPAIAVVLVSGALVTATRARNAEYATALRLVETIASRRPSGVSHHMLGEQLALAGRLEEGMAQLRTALALGNSRAHYPLGVLLLQRRETTAAAREFEAVVGLADVPQRLRWLEPPLVEVLQARALLGQIYAAEGRWSEAEVQARAVLSRTPRHVDALRVLAAAMVGQQRWDDAIAAGQAYLESRPTDAQALVNLGIALVATGRVEEAVTSFQRAVDADPSHPTAKRLLDLALRDRAKTARQP